MTSAKSAENMQTMLKKPVDKNHKKNEKMSPSGENRSLSDGEAPAAMTPLPDTTSSMKMSPNFSI